MSPFLRAFAWVLAIQTLEAAAVNAKSPLVRSSKPIMGKSATSLLQEIEEMARAGQAPDSEKVNIIKNIVADELKPDLEKTHAAAVVVVGENLASIDECNSNSLTRATEIQTTTEVTVGEKRDGHETCRIAEKGKTATRDQECKELDDFLDLVRDPVNLPTQRRRAEMVDYVKDKSQYFCPKGPEVIILDKECTDAETERVKQKVICDRDQATFEAGFCTWRTELMDNCAALSVCYEAAVKTYTEHKTATSELVTKWKLEWAALDKILCYLDVWIGEGAVQTGTVDAAAYSHCNAKTPDTSSMDIDFGTAADQAVCPLDAVANHPGTSGFVAIEYHHDQSEFSAFVEDSISCISSAQGATTLAPASFAETSSVEADGTVHTAYQRSHLEDMEVTELMRLLKSMGASTSDIKGALADSIMEI